MQPRTEQAWLETVPKYVKEGPLWKLKFYRKAMFLYDLCWIDWDAWMQDVRGKAIVQQLIRSCGSVSANIEEGYGRGFGRDYARFLSIALGSARETRGWYTRAHNIITPDTLEHRIFLCDEIISMLIATIKYQRQQAKK